MKKLCMAFIASLFLFVSCGKKTENTESTHTHEDGSVHSDHGTDSTQQEFNAADTAHHEHDSTTHDHSHPH
jgi:hypothetical protein